MALYDIPAMIDYVLTYTDRPNLPYIGFSMGTSMMFAALSENRELNDKVN